MHDGGSKLKKVLLIVIIVILLVILALELYSNYAESRVNEYLTHIPITIETFTGKEVKNLELDRVIKKSPKEIIILVKWESNSAFISIKDWMLRKAHDEMEIRVFESKQGIKIYE
jgi:hypothetical protein